MSDSKEKIIWSRNPAEISVNSEYAALPELRFENVAPGINRSENWDEVQQAWREYISRHGLEAFLERANPERQQD